MNDTLSDVLKGRLGLALALRMERALARFDNLETLDIHGDGICTLGPSGMFTFMNPAFKSIVGLGDDDEVGEIPWQSFFFLGNPFRFLRAANKSLISRGFWRGKVRARGATGTDIYVSLTIVLLETGEIICVLHKDITKGAHPNAMFDYITFSNACAKSGFQNFSQRTSHDFANLLAVVSGTVDLMQSSPDQIETGLGRLRMILEAAESSLAALRNYARSDDIARYHDVGDILSAACAFVMSYETRCNQITEAERTATQFVWTNEADFHHIAIVLLGLAARAAVKGHVTLDSTDASPCLKRPVMGTLDVAQSYCAIKIQFQCSSSTPELDYLTNAAKLTSEARIGGMDPSALSMILSEYRAAIGYEKGAGNNTTITLFWPDNAARSTTHSDHEQTHDHSALEGHNILVVDDSPFMSDLISKILDERGAIAMAVSNPDDALTLVRDTPNMWSAMITDFHMPEMSGIELAEQCAKLAPDMPMLLVTALPQDAVAGERLFSTVLSKPVKSDQLVNAVIHAITQNSTTSYSALRAP